MFDILPPIIMQLGIGAICGFFVGYLLKQALKFAVVIGVFVFVLTYFVYESSIQIDYSQLISRIESVATPAYNFIYPVISQIPVLASLVVGALLGFTRS